MLTFRARVDRYNVLDKNIILMMKDISKTHRCMSKIMVKMKTWDFVAKQVAKKRKIVWGSVWFYDAKLLCEALLLSHSHQVCRPDFEKNGKKSVCWFMCVYYLNKIDIKIWCSVMPNRFKITFSIHITQTIDKLS